MPWICESVGVERSFPAVCARIAPLKGATSLNPRYDALLAAGAQNNQRCCPAVVAPAPACLGHANEISGRINLDGRASFAHQTHDVLATWRSASEQAILVTPL